MSSATIAILDPFEPVILDVIKAALPSTWTMAVAADNSERALLTALKDADAAFVVATPLPGDLLNSAPRLGFIQKLGAGVDRIDLDVCRSRGIGLARLYAGNAMPVAEHTVMLMLAAYRRLPNLDRDTRQGGWAKEESRAVNRHIFGKTIGIIGMGAIGQAVATALAGFGVNVLYNDPVQLSPMREAELRVKSVSLNSLLAHSDIVSLHLPLTDETENFFNESLISLMKPGSVLVNCARGPLVDEVALVRALDSGHLFSAALDVFAKEPPVNSPVLVRENTVVTPHCAGATIDNIAAIARRAVSNTKCFMEGKSLPPDDVWIAPGRPSAA